MFTQADIFETWDEVHDAVTPLKPRMLDRESWPPDYRAIFAWRIETLVMLRSDPANIHKAHAYYSTHPAEFIMHWMDTYNPRKVDPDPKWMPFVLFEKQYEFVQFLEDLRFTREGGLVEKCRDIGATWLAAAYSVWCIKYLPDDSTGWGSRKENLVDKLGDPDSIFEKMRLLIRRLPPEFRPNISDTFMKFVNEENGASITGEAGDNIGRGGRKSRYFVDESAHIERAEKVDAALGDNTDVQVHISSVNGLGNLFHRKREAGELWHPDHDIPKGVTRVFVFDWRDHPEKDQEWYDRRKAKAEREGMQHIFAQEVDRAYDAAVANTVISYKWLEACVDAHLEIDCLKGPPSGARMAGFDLADDDEGGAGDKNALVIRQGIVLRHIEEWGDRDTAVTTNRAIASLKEHGAHGMQVQYDCIGVGSGVKAEVNRLVEKGELTNAQFEFVPWHAGSKVVRKKQRVIADDHESPKNEDFFHNFKAQAWWDMRTRVYKTWRARTQGEVYQPEELISFSSEIPQPMLLQLMKELAQPTQGKSAASLKMLINKKPSGTRSPNLADATVQCYFPVPDKSGEFEIRSRNK